MSSLLFWLFLHSICVTGGRHYLFWPSLFVLAVPICSGRHYLLTEIEWRISQNNNDDIWLPLCLLFLICCKGNIHNYTLQGGWGLVECRNKLHSCVTYSTNNFVTFSKLICLNLKEILSSFYYTLQKSVKMLTGIT